MRCESIKVWPSRFLILWSSLVQINLHASVKLFVILFDYPIFLLDFEDQLLCLSLSDFVVKNCPKVIYLTRHFVLLVL